MNNVFKFNSKLRPRSKANKEKHASERTNPFHEGGN